MQHAGPSSPQPPPAKAEQQAAAAAASARTRAAGQRGFAGYTPSTHHSLADSHDAAWERDAGAAGAPQPPAPAPGAGEATRSGAADDEAEADAQAADGGAERNPQEEPDWMAQMVREPEAAPAQDDEGRAAAEEQLQQRLDEGAAPSAADAQNAGLEFPSTSSDAMAAVMRLAQAASSYDATDAGTVSERAGEWHSAEQEGMPQAEATQGEGEQSNRRPLSTSKRAAQNRAAQRAFRERRDKRVKELEMRISLLEPTQLYANELRIRLAETNAHIAQLRELLLARGVPEEEVPSPPNHPELQAPPVDITEEQAAGSPPSGSGEAGPSKKRRKSGKTKSPQMHAEYAHHPDDASMLDLAAAAAAPHAQHETDGLEWLEQHQGQAHGHVLHQGNGNEEAALDSLSAVAVEAAAAAAHAAAHEHAAQDEAQVRAEMLEHEAHQGQGEQEMQEPPQLEEPAEEQAFEPRADDEEAAAAQAAA